MMRWKPSVSSRSSSAAGFCLTAASAMGVLPGFLALRSVQIISVTLDVLGKAERVRANELLGARGVARLESLDDVHVVADRAVGAVLLADRLPPDHPHMREQVLGER